MSDLKYKENQRRLMVNGKPVSDRVFCGSHQPNPIYQLKKLDGVFRENLLFKNEEDCIYFEGDLFKTFNL